MSRLANPKEERENTGGAAASSDSNDSSTPKERKGGLGRDKAARKFENASQEEREAANSDGKFGYYDMVNKRYVPAIVDAMDGGGFDTRGDKFKGGPFSALLNKLGVNPYGSQRERLFVAPNTSSAIQAAVQGGSGDGGGVRPVLRPDNFMTEAQKEQVVMNQPVLGSDVDPYAPKGGPNPEVAAIIAARQNALADPYAPVGGTNPAVAQEIARRQALQAEAQRMQSYEPVGPSTIANPMSNVVSAFDTQFPTPHRRELNDISSQGFNRDPQLNDEVNRLQRQYAFDYDRDASGKLNSMPNPAAFSANLPSAAAMTAPSPAPADRNPQLAAFNQAMSTVPAMLKGTEIEDMYRDHLLNGGGGTFAQFTGAQ